jgi:hypothetical protein
MAAQLYGVPHGILSVFKTPFYTIISFKILKYQPLKFSPEPSTLAILLLYLSYLVYHYGTLRAIELHFFNK